MTDPTMLQKLEAAVASCETEGGELKGYALVTLHDGFYNMTCATHIDNDDAMEVIEDLAETLGYHDEPETLQ